MGTGLEKEAQGSPWRGAIRAVPERASEGPQSQQEGDKKSVRIPQATVCTCTWTEGLTALIRFTQHLWRVYLCHQRSQFKLMATL